RKEHFLKMKDGAMICNSGHFDVEIDIPELEKSSKTVNLGIRQFVDEYILPNQHRIYLLAKGRLINLSSAEGHPASVMDMSFSVQALAAEYAVKHQKDMSVKVHNISDAIDEDVSKLKLDAMGICIDTLTEEQKRYLSSWEIGT
ncbi:MAG: adenosylhomocysteinase, partial [Chlamydiota bacterium]|nr:adenosylhomocysteinase [Chlamydiota bacterium]